MILRDYQQRLIDDIRLRIKRGDKAILAQSPTGSGKSAVIGEIIRLAKFKNPASRCWILAPRNNLVDQLSETLRRFNIPHGRIDAAHQESKAFSTHVISKDTLIRRLDNIQNWPGLVVIDEGHLFFDGQKKIIGACPDGTFIFGFSASPERLDGKALSDIYDSIVYGPSIMELTERGYLAPLRYFAPDLPGLSDLKYKGQDVDENELEELFSERAVYGDMLRHYKKYAAGKPTLVFCRSIKHAENVAHRFREAGFKFEPIEGKTPKKKQKELLAALESGKIDGLTSAELITYGIDLPKLEAIIMLRPTASRALYNQMVGRVIRPGKPEAIVIDHVNNIRTHGHVYSETPWNFEGTQVRAPKKSCELCEFADEVDTDEFFCRRYESKITGERCAELADQCPYFVKIKERRLTLCNSCWMYGPTPCSNCGKDERKTQKELEEKDAELVEMVGPVKLAMKPQKEAQEIETRIGELITQFRSSPKFNDSAVKELLEIAHKSDRHAMWVYRTLHRNATYMINVELLHAIAHNAIGKKGGPSKQEKVRGWIWYQSKNLKEKKR